MTNTNTAPFTVDPFASNDDIRIMTHAALGMDSSVVPFCVIVNGVNHIKAGITAISGGVSLHWGIGTWVQGAEDWRCDDPRGANAIEGCTVEETVTANFLLTLTEEEQHRLWPDIQAVIREGVESYKLLAEYVHCMTWRVQSNIFTISVPTALSFTPQTAFADSAPANSNLKTRG